MTVREGQDPNLWRFIGETDTNVRELQDRALALEQAVATGECRCGHLTSEEEFASAEASDRPLSMSRLSVGAVSPSVSGVESGGSDESTANEVAEQLLQQTGFYEPHISNDTCIDLVGSLDVQLECPGIGWVPRSIIEGDISEDEEIWRYINSTRHEGTPEEEDEDSEGPSVE